MTAVSRSMVRSRCSCCRRPRVLRVSTRASAAVSSPVAAGSFGVGGASGSQIESPTYDQAAPASQPRPRRESRARRRPWRRQPMSSSRSWALVLHCSPNAPKARSAAPAQSFGDQRSSAWSSALRMVERINPWRWKGHRPNRFSRTNGRSTSRMAGASWVMPAARVARARSKASRRLTERRTCRSSGVRSDRVRATRAGKSWSKSVGVGVWPERRSSRNRITDRSRYSGRPCERPVMTRRMSLLMRGWPSRARRRAR